MVTEFTHVLDSFDFIQHVDKATHVLGHTLDLVMSYGFPIDNISIEDALSQIISLLFSMSYYQVLHMLLKIQVFILVVLILSLQINFLICNKTNDVSTAILAAAEQSSSPENLISLFNSSSSAILDSVAPFKYKSPKFKSQPWLDDTTRSFRQICRKAERRWKKDHLTVSFEIFKNSLVNFQKAARKARAKFFSDIISKYSHTPKILFSTINSIINPRTSNEAEPSADICERFLRFFVEKIDGFRSSLIPSYSNTLLECPVNTVKFNSFQPVSLFESEELSDAGEIYNLAPGCCSFWYH